MDRVFGDKSWERLYEEDFADRYKASRDAGKPKNLPLFDLGEIEPNPTYEFRAHASAISYLYRERLKTVFAGSFKIPLPCWAPKDRPSSKYISL